MATAAPANNRQQQTMTQQRPGEFEALMNRSVRFTPLAESEPIEISVGMVKNILAVRSRSGREPGQSDIIKFMMLCKSRGLNPFVGDAYLLGYDNQDGQTQWTLITAIQALRKRAEANPQFDGCPHGVVVIDRDGQLVDRDGALTLEGDKIVGGWAYAYRKDRAHTPRTTVKFSAYDTGRSRWKKDPSGMISKVAEAAGLREAFPSDLAGLYIRDEFDSDGDAAERQAESAPKGVAGLKEQLTGMAAHVTPAAAPQADDEPDQSADQSVDESADGIDEPGNDDVSQDETSGANPAAPTKAELEEQASGKPGKAKQKSAFENSPEYK